MTTPFPLPADVVSAEVARGSATLAVDPSLYPLQALYGAAYVFIDRCYVFLTKDAQGRVVVTLTPKTGTVDETGLRKWVGEFSNELLSCSWRNQITAQNRQVLEQVTSLALAGAMGPPSLDDLANFDFSSQPLEDPLGIAMSWEEKYKKKPPAAAAPTGAATTPEASKP
jgi:His-Xaa-Ser system protein HxsD